MTHSIMLFATFLAVVMMAGCSGKEEPATAPPAKPAEKAKGEATKSIADLTDTAAKEARKAAEDAKRSAEAKKADDEAAATKAADEAAAMKAAADAEAKKAADDAAAKNAAAEAAAKKAADEAAQDAQSLLAKIIEWIKSGKLDEADAQLKALESKAGSLSPGLQEQVKSARSALTAAQQALKLPGGLPSLPK